MSDSAALLEQSLAAWDARRFLDALDLALAAWRAHRAPELATVVEAMGARLGERLPRVLNRKTTRALRSWAELAQQRRAIDLGRLLSPLHYPHWSKLPQRLELLAGFADDPRLASALTRLALSLPPSHQRGDATWKALFALIERHADVRTFDTMQERRRHDRTLRFDVAQAIEAMLMPAVAPPSAAEARALAALTTAVATSAAPSPEELAPPGKAPPPDGGEACLAAVYADPDDDHARLVYADWLLEREDARGQLILLQLAAHPTLDDDARAHALIAAHADKWLAPIAPLLAVGACTWERGFVSAAPAPRHVPEALAPLIDHAAWSTLRTLDVWQADTDFLVGCELRGLETLAGALPLGQLAAMVTRPRPYARLRTLHVTLEHGAATQVERRRILDGEAMPALRELHLNVGARGDDPLPPWEWLLNARCCAGVEELWIYDSADEDGVRARLRGLSRLRRIHFAVL